jgi:hypothetical protein
MASCEDTQHEEIKNLTAELGAGGPRQRFRYNLDCSIGVALRSTVQNCVRRGKRSHSGLRLAHGHEGQREEEVKTIK